MHMNNECGCSCEEPVLQVGSPAPRFRAEALLGEEFTKVALDDYRGKWVVLFFYPLDFTFVCPTEIQGFNERYDEFLKLNAVVLGCSVDSIHSHKSWVKNGLGKLEYPLLSDITHGLSAAYGVLVENEGTALRGAFIIDPDGILKYQVVSDNNVGRSVGEILRVLQALQSGDLCQVNWKPGEKTLGKA